MSTDIREPVQLMDRKYLIDLLTEYIRNIEIVQLYGTMHRFLPQQLNTAQDELHELEYPVRQAIDGAKQGLGNFKVDRQLSLDKRWNAARLAAIQARGIYGYAEEVRRSLMPDSPTISADGLHPWVWESAKQLLDSGHHVEAIGAALRTVNARLQQKLGRRDVSEKALVEQAFSLKPNTT